LHTTEAGCKAASLFGGQEQCRPSWTTQSRRIYILELVFLQALTVQRATEKVAIAKLKELAYIRQEIKNPLCGITFTRQLLEDTDLSDDQKQFLDTSAVCEQQLQKVLNDMDLESIEDG
jgi:phytochrome B